MRETNELTLSKSESVLINIEKVSQIIQQEDLEILADAIHKEIGDRKLNKEEIEQLQEIMNVDALEGAKWKNVADVLKYMSVFAVAESNPDALKISMEKILGVVGLFYPAANIAHNVLAQVPEQLFSALIKIGGLASPEYLIYRGASMIATHKSEKAKAQAEFDASAHDNMTTLIIVSKNRQLSAEMDKLVKLEDDLDSKTVVGTKDNTVHTIIWNESAWEAFRDKLTVNDKVLIIGKVKNAPLLTAEQIRFEQFGVKYGWSNNVATIEAEPKVLSRTVRYNDFLTAMKTVQVSEKLKKNAKVKFDWVTAGKLALFPPLLIGDVLREDTEIKKQQLLFGLYNLYMQDLDAFLNSKESM